MTDLPGTLPQKSAGFESFKEIAAKSLGIVEQDEIELLPLSTVLARIETLYSREITLFDSTAARLTRDEAYYLEVATAVKALRKRLVSMGIPESKACALQSAAIEEAVFSVDAGSDAHVRLCDQFKPQVTLNPSRGDHLFDFMLAHFMQQSPHFERLNRGVRAVVINYAGSLESIYSIWENNRLGRVWTTVGATLPRMAYAEATYRLVDGLCSVLGFQAAFGIFVKHLNPLAQFPLQFIYNVITSDPKTLLQEYAQANRGTVPRYNVLRIGGADHVPEFHCTMTFAQRTYEGHGDSKSRAELIAARKALEFLLENDRRKMPLLIANKIALGMIQDDTANSSARIAYQKLMGLRQITGASCSDETLRRCLTLRADLLAYRLSEVATNELMAFCGSWLAAAIDAGVPPEIGDRPYAIHPVARDEVQKTRYDAFPRSRDRLSDSQLLDVIQAIMYTEFLLKGYDAAVSMFDRCMVRYRAGVGVQATGSFDPNFGYTTLLQELTQKYGGLPQYHYVLTTPPNKAHAPIFRCRAAYDGKVAEGLGASKKMARQKAAFHLLQKLMEGSDDTRTP